MEVEIVEEAIVAGDEGEAEVAIAVELLLMTTSQRACLATICKRKARNYVDYLVRSRATIGECAMGSSRISMPC